MSSYGHAVVVGASMAGLWAARVLADHFDQVTVIERDRFPETPEPRNGVPQARHVHVLLAQGQRIMEDLFPGIDTELAEAGAPTVTWSSECAMYGQTGWAVRYDSDLVSRTCSRDLLEWHVRRRLFANPKVEFVEHHTVTGLMSDATGAVTGVQFHGRDADVEGEEALMADLVVDASGRDSKMPEWFAELGYSPPERTAINPFLGYASRWYEQPPGFEPGWKSLLLFARPPDEPTGGIIYPVEGDHWIVTLAGTACQYPPTDEDEFLEFARNLRVPDLYEVICAAEPVTPIFGYRRTENRLYHYERLSRWPDGLVILGDAVCAFNPVYGQGMTVSALGAMTLGDCLREQAEQHAGRGLNGLGQRFQRRLAQVIATPWLMATSEDFRWPATEGAAPDWQTRLMHRYLDRVVVATESSPTVSLAFWQVTHLIKPPSALFHPRVLGRVLTTRGSMEVQFG